MPPTEKLLVAYAILDVVSPEVSDAISTVDGKSVLRQLVERRLVGESDGVRATLAFLGELLAEAAGGLQTPHEFICRCLEAEPSGVVNEKYEARMVFAASIGAVLSEEIAAHNPVIGPAETEERQSWRRIELRDGNLSVPDKIALFFSPGTLAAVPVVVRLAEGPYFTGDVRELSVHTRTADRAAAEPVLDEILSRARGERNLYRGHVVQATVDHSEPRFTIIDTPEVTRDQLVFDAAVWRELDLNLAAIGAHADLMRRMGFGTRRGILLSGPPGVGKTAIGRLVAAELAGDFTVIVVDARTGAEALPAIYRETRDLGPTVVILEDVDLYLGNRERNSRPGTPLADFLAVMDGTEQYDDVLTIATTNDPSVLDKAAVRSARFDTVIEIPYPDRVAAAAILRHYLAPLPDPESIDAAAVVASLPEDISGADLREIVRRTVLAHGPTFGTGDMLAAVAEGRWRPAPPTGNYL